MNGHLLSSHSLMKKMQVRPGNSNPINQKALPITQTYNDQGSCTHMLERAGVSAVARCKLLDDDSVHILRAWINLWEIIPELVLSDSAQWPREDLKPSSFTMWYLVGCLHYIPNMDDIDINTCPGLIQALDYHQRQRITDSDNEVIIELPELNGCLNWTI